MSRFSHRIALYCFSFFLASAQIGLCVANAERPNIVVIMVDDLGYSDLGCYGSEIDTPCLDSLADNGLRFSQFYNTAKCHSSRVSLLTGQYCMAAGDTALSHAVTSAEVLRDAGYFTAMTGKWHLREEPTDFGFDRYFGHLSGACNFFKGDKTFRLNGVPWNVPQEGFYTTVANVDFALEFLQEARLKQKPWYLYVAFNAPHAPLHALREDYEKYKGRYSAGWDTIRQARVDRQKELGLLSPDQPPSPRPEHIPAWEELEPWRQDYEANRMTTLAAMIDRVDQEIQRLVNDLRAHDELENTLLLFVSDNGACPYDRRQPQLDVEPVDGDTFFSDSTGWAWARNTPFRFYKQNQFEGGIATPAIVHWPNGLKTKPGSLSHEPAHLIDVMPTLAEVSRSTIPKEWSGRELRKVTGVSLAPLFNNQPIRREQPLHFLFAADRGLRLGDWKIVSFRSEAWELYNLAHDRCELHNLAMQEPTRVESMVEKWTTMSREVLHAPPNSYKPVGQVKSQHRHPEWTDFDGSGTNRKRGVGSRSLGIRARKHTQLRIEGSDLKMTFDGDDPGIAMDLRQTELPAGPYYLTFQLRGGTPEGGEVYFTVDPQKTLPKGKHFQFPVIGNDEWQTLKLELSTMDVLQQLRIDVSHSKGKATIRDLALRDHSGKILQRWPTK